MDWIIALVIIAGLVVVALWARKHFAPEIERYKKIKRANEIDRKKRSK